MKIEFKNYPKIIIVFALFLAFIAVGCGSDDAAPDYVSPEANETIKPNGPKVDDNLAKEAWQQRLIYRAGPVSLPAGTKPMLDKPAVFKFQIDEPVWVIGFAPRVVDESGSELPPELLHQTIVLNMHEENQLCSSSGGGNPIFIATSMMTEVDLPEGYGYPILHTDPIEISAIFANPTDKSYEGVSFELALIARSMNEFTEVADVRAMLVESNPCTHEALKVGPGSLEEKTSVYQMPDSVKIVAANGALQAYGASVELVAGKETEPFWKAEALLDDAHKLTGLTDNPFTDPKGIAFKKGDELTFGVTYNNTSQEWINSATGAAMVYAAPTD